MILLYLAYSSALQFNDVLEIFAHLCIDLASAPETRRPEVIDATKALTKCVFHFTWRGFSDAGHPYRIIAEVRDAQLAGNAEAIKALKGTVDKEVAEVKVFLSISVFFLAFSLQFVVSIPAGAAWLRCS